MDADPWGDTTLPVPNSFTKNGEPPVVTLTGLRPLGGIEVAGGTVRIRFIEDAGTVTADAADPPAPPGNKPLVTIGRRPGSGRASSPTAPGTGPPAACPESWCPPSFPSPRLRWTPPVPAAARTHVRISKRKNRSPCMVVLRLPKRPPRRGLTRTGEDRTMTGRGAALPATTRNARESPPQRPPHAAKRTNRKPCFEAMDRMYGRAEDPPSEAAGTPVNWGRIRRQAARRDSRASRLCPPDTAKVAILKHSRSDIPHIPSKFVEIVPLSHRQGNCIPYAAIRWHDFGNRPALGRPLGHFSRHPDTPLLSLSPRRRFPRPTPERVFVADHQSSSGFSGTGPSAPPPQPIGT